MAERERFMEAIKSSNNAVIYSGDSHNAWASNIKNGDGNLAAVEYAGTSVTSPGWEQRMKYISPDLTAAGFMAANPDLRYTNTEDRGFMVFEVTHDKHAGEYVYVSNIGNRQCSHFCETGLTLYPKGKGTGVRGSEDGLQLSSCELYNSALNGNSGAGSKEVVLKEPKQLYGIQSVPSKGTPVWLAVVIPVVALLIATVFALFGALLYKRLKARQHAFNTLQEEVVLKGDKRGSDVKSAEPL